jgi:molybdate transport system regulatory protein
LLSADNFVCAKFYIYLLGVKHQDMANSLKNILKKNLSFKVNGSLWLECGGKKYFGPGPMELLEKIAKTGSINKAARQMGMSYKKAWEIINRLNKNAALPLVKTQSGGEKGGGSVISLEAKQLIAYHIKLRKKFLTFLEKQTTLLA